MKFCQNKYKKILFLILIFLLDFGELPAIEIEEQLGNLTSEEKECLAHFFTTAIKRDHLGHVLFFTNKPASLLGAFINKQTPSNKLFIKGWNVWREKEHYFPHPNFIIVHETVDFGPDAALRICFINKKTLSNFLSKNEDLLREISGINFSKEDFIKNFEENKIGSLFELDQALLGLLLGYGAEASQAYKQYRIQAKQDDQLKLILCAQNGKVTIEDQTALSCGSRSEKPVLCILNENTNVHPVTFFGELHSKEVQILQEIYANELEEIEALFEQKELLKLSLQALCQD